MSDEEWEEQIAWLLDVKPPAGNRSLMDERLAALITPRQQDARLALKSSRYTGQIPRRLTVLAVAAMVLAAAAIGTTALQRLVSAPAGAMIVFDRGQVIGQTETAHGYSVTVERAYADANELQLVMDAKGSNGSSSMVPTEAQVTDAAGRSYGMLGGQYQQAPADSAVVLSFDVPATAAGGQQALTIIVPEIRPAAPSPGTARPVEGPWVFTVETSIAPGRQVDANLPVTAGGISATVRRLAIAPSSAVVTVELGGALPQIGARVSWSVSGVLRTPSGETLPLTSTAATGANPGTLTVRTDRGADSWNGNWQLSIDGIQGLGSALSGAQATFATVTGPWTYMINVP